MDFLGDTTITTAILDRLIHRCEIINMSGNIISRSSAKQQKTVYFVAKKCAFYLTAYNLTEKWIVK